MHAGREDNVDGDSALGMVGKVVDILGVLNCLEEELQFSVDGAEELGSKAGYRGEHVG
jgi:hypothetical protein